MHYQPNMQCWPTWDTCQQKCVVDYHWPSRCIDKNSLLIVLLNHIDPANNAHGLCVTCQTTHTMPMLVTMKKMPCNKHVCE
jgi:hypothetical protein